MRAAGRAPEAGAAELRAEEINLREEVSRPSGDGVLRRENMMTYRQPNVSES